MCQVGNMSEMGIKEFLKNLASIWQPYDLQMTVEYLGVIPCWSTSGALNEKAIQ